MIDREGDVLDVCGIVFAQWGIVNALHVGFQFAIDCMLEGGKGSATVIGEVPYF